MEIPGIGMVTIKNEFGSYYRNPLPVRVLGEKLCRIVVEGYDEDANKEDFHVAIANFLSIEPSVLSAVETEVFRYYKDLNDGCWTPEDDEYVTIDSPSDVWEQVRFGDETVVTGRHNGDKGIYVSLCCECDWEDEHGLQIVFKNGLCVNKIGGFDGHLTTPMRLQMKVWNM